MIRYTELVFRIEDKILTGIGITMMISINGILKDHKVIIQKKRRDLYLFKLHCLDIFKLCLLKN
jgi:hypothetical protein